MRLYTLGFVALHLLLPLLFINVIFYIIAWSKVRELSRENKEIKEYQTHKGNLTFVKILFCFSWNLTYMQYFTYI